MREYHIVPRLNGWAVRRRGATRASRLFAHKPQASVYAFKRADVVYTHRRDGTVESVSPPDTRDTERGR